MSHGPVGMPEGVLQLYLLHLRRQIHT
jgi:hypothetical protein